MIKVNEWTNKDIVKYGRLIGQAFADSEGTPAHVPREYTIKAYMIFTEFFYNTGVLYATSENYEGFVAYWDKKTKFPFKYTLRMNLMMLKHIPLKYILITGTPLLDEYLKTYRGEKDFIAISMIVVLRKYQGQGYTRKLMKQPLREAEKRGCLAVGDTDSPQLAAMYEHFGMKRVDEFEIEPGLMIYTMEYSGNTDKFSLS